MSHHRLSDWPTYTHKDIESGIKRAHALRSQAIGRFFRKALDRRYRALDIAAGEPCKACRISFTPISLCDLPRRKPWAPLTGAPFFFVRSRD